MLQILTRSQLPVRMLLSASVDAMVDTEVGMQWNLRHTGKVDGIVRKYTGAPVKKP